MKKINPAMSHHDGNEHLPHINQIIVGHAATVMAGMPAGSIDLIVTSPPYWTAVTYSAENPWHSYEDYLADMQTVWVECARVLRPNGKLCINAMMSPIPNKLAKKIGIKQHTRVIKDIPCDIQQRILAETT